METRAQKKKREEAMAMAIRGQTKKRKEEEEEVESVLLDLPADLLDPIADKLPSIQDFVRLGAVSWRVRRFAVDKEKDRSINLSHPWLMFSDDHKDHDSLKRRFYSLTRGELFELELVTGGEYGILSKRGWGSPFGWLVLYSYDLDVFLFNPLSGASITLPRLHRFLLTQYHIHQPDMRRRGPPDDIAFFFCVAKLLLTAPPHSPNCYVFAIFFDTHRLGFLNMGVRRLEWLPIDGFHLWSDIVSFQGTFFGCLKDGRLLTLDMSSSDSPKAVAFAPPQELEGDAESDGRKYLLDLRGELCMVVRCGNAIDRFGLEFRVFTINMSTKQWTRIMSLGGHCLFLGTNYSYAVQASDQLKPDCIYFTNDDHTVWSQIPECGTGIYHLINAQVTAFTPPPSVADQMINLERPPLWFTPSLH